MCAIPVFLRQVTEVTFVDPGLQFEALLQSANEVRGSYGLGS